MRPFNSEPLNRAALLSKIFLIMAVIVSCLYKGPCRAESLESIDTAYAIVFYEPGAVHGAEKTAEIYPEIKSLTEKLFQRYYPRKAVIVLVANRQRFVQMAGHPITVAYAVPSKNLIVMDYSVTAVRPYSLETTLTHEFCHLLLHLHVPKIPRWLDEGLCQWASGGIDEIIYNRDRSALKRAAVTGNFIPFENLAARFPAAERARILAYEQSKSFVSYLAGEYGKEKLLEVLDRLASGKSTENAFYETYQKELEQMESSWRDSMGKNYNWLVYISSHLYEILFAAGALLTVAAFLKMVLRKHRYKDEDIDE